MSRVVIAEPLSTGAFAEFGEVIEASGQPDKIINRGLCERYHDRAALDFTDGRAGISVFRAQSRKLPLTLDMVERHPDGSQSFIPMSLDPFLAVVASDEEGEPGRLRAFITAPGQGVSYRRGVWHGVLTPLNSPGLFAVVDRIGPGANLEERWLPEAWTIVAP